MDDMDKQIIAVLEHDARLSFSALGRKVRLSRTAVQDRVRKLEERGVIAGYKLELGGDDLLRAVVFLKLETRPCEPALVWLAEQAGVQEVLSLAGEWDVLLRCAVSGPAALTRLNDRLGGSPHVALSQSSIVLSRR